MASSRAKLRLGVLVAIGAYLHLGAALDLFGGQTPGWTQPWRMYHGYGVDVCDVRFYDVATDPDTPLDRYEALGVDFWQSFSRDRRMGNADEIREQARRICRRNRITDLRAEARCGSRTGWRPLMDRGQNLCLPRKRR